RIALSWVGEAAPDWVLVLRPSALAIAALLLPPTVRLVGEVSDGTCRLRVVPARLAVSPDRALSAVCNSARVETWPWPVPNVTVCAAPPLTAKVRVAPCTELAPPSLAASRSNRLVEL